MQSQKVWAGVLLGVSLFNVAVSLTVAAFVEDSTMWHTDIYVDCIVTLINTCQLPKTTGL